jgi:hypothetical protein
MPEFHHLKNPFPDVKPFNPNAIHRDAQPFRRLLLEAEVIAVLRHHQPALLCVFQYVCGQQKRARPHGLSLESNDLVALLVVLELGLPAERIVHFFVSLFFLLFFSSSFQSS